jgi:putative nucleotidyltransferase with HDIG domain
MTDIIKQFQEQNKDLVWWMKRTTHHHADESNQQVTCNPYHLEGDVWSHTMMVVANAMDETLWERDKLLLYATLLHDIGKIHTRKNSTKNPGRVHFYGHAGVSFWMAVDLLNGPFGKSLTSHEKQIVLEVVSLHHNYMDHLSTTKIFTDFVENFPLMNMVRKHSICDSLGRVFEDGSHDFDRDHIDCTVWGQSPPYIPAKEPGPTVTLLIGPPASGKTTISSNFERVVSRDAIIEHVGSGDTYTEKFDNADHGAIDKLFNHDLKVAFSNNESFMVDKTHVSPKSRRHVLHTAPKHYWKRAIVVANAGYETLLRRNLDREGKVIPMHVMMKMMKGFTVPLYNEFDVIEYLFT